MRSRSSVQAPHYSPSLGAATTLHWVSQNMESVGTLLFGTANGYVCLWLNNVREGSFVELTARCIAPAEILSLASDPSANPNELQFAVSLADAPIHLLHLDGEFNLVSLRVLSFSFRSAFLSFIPGSRSITLRAFTFNGGTMHTINGNTGEVLDSVGMHQHMYVHPTIYCAIVRSQLWRARCRRNIDCHAVRTAIKWSLTAQRSSRRIQWRLQKLAPNRHIASAEPVSFRVRRPLARTARLSFAAATTVGSIFLIG
jgi:hypothetical protein